MTQKIIVLCDFDGTITNEDALEPIYTRFASCGTYFAELWHLGQIGTREEMVETFNCIHADRLQLESVLDEITIDEGIHDLLTYCKFSGFEFAILSDGLEWYIRYILKNYGVFEVNIFANQIIFNRDGSYQFEFPWFNHNNPKRALHKPAIIDQYHRAGYHTIFLGNGSSDQDAVWEAERIYAKKPLYDYCLAKQIDVKHFESFADLLGEWKINSPHAHWRENLTKNTEYI